MAEKPEAVAVITLRLNLVLQHYLVSLVFVALIFIPKVMVISTKASVCPSAV